MDLSSLTKPQRRMYDDLASGPRIYNGRARRTIDALEEAGLVTAVRDMIPQWKGSGMELVDRITVTRVEQ